MTGEARQACFAPHASELPVGRVGQPDDGAQAIAFLVGNGYTTGTIMECDGGLHLV
ncbi:SDR family oxidoreductase [Burkholderia sp. BCC0405]|uniref:SDR family oxidoreductase n=1 Tax=Burkholderia sp. BCC0405 TaxID=2676298 RepID=UPI001589215F|nr:SDR family oxidoreductase [Burkholderia sp. BCC0405]